MLEEIRSIGALARESGLTVSALRYYDAAGVLRPARVDPATGYRWYTADQVAEARLVAALRRVRMPLADIRAVLAARHTARAGAILDRHLRRLEAGLTNARRQLAAAHALLAPLEGTMTRCTVHAADLAAALPAVRFAVSTDPELPALHGILFDLKNDILQLVATDRYRLAMVTVRVRGSGGRAQALVPAAELDGLELTTGELALDVTAGALTIDGRRIPTIDAEFPDYRRLLPTDQPTRIAVPAADLRHRVAAGPTRALRQQPGDREHLVSILRVAGGEVHVIDDDAPDAIGVNREFLLQALDAGHAGQLTLALDGPIQPLALLNPDRPGDLSLLMPVRLNQPSPAAVSGTG